MFRTEVLISTSADYDNSYRYYYGTVEDNDSPSLIVTPEGIGPDLATVTEGATTTFDVSLGSAPLFDVILILTNTEQVSLSDYGTYIYLS